MMLHLLANCWSNRIFALFTQIIIIIDARAKNRWNRFCKISTSDNTCAHEKKPPKKFDGAACDATLINSIAIKEQIYI